MQNLSNEKSSPLVSIIILNFNGANYLDRCLFSVFATQYPNFEVIFVDNASTDSSLRIVEKAFGNDRRLRIFRSDKNLGFSGGNNFGFCHAKGDYIVFLNNDTIADPLWLAALVSTMQNDETIGLAGSTILSIDGKKLRGAGGLWSDYLLFLCPIGAGRSGDFEFIPIFEVSFATGCSMIIKKDFLLEIGLFDAKIPYHYDDTLLSLKTWLAGKRVVSVSNSRIRHIGGATTKSWTSKSVTFSLLRAKMCLLFDTYFNFRSLFKALFILYFSISIESILLMRNKNLQQILGNIQASFWMFRNLRYLWKNRFEHWNHAKISPKILQKYIRIRLPFPICAIRSELTNLVYQQECSKYEKMILRDHCEITRLHNDF